MLSAGALTPAELAALLRGAFAAFQRLSIDSVGTYSARCEITSVMVLVLKAITAQVGIQLSRMEGLQRYRYPAEEQTARDSRPMP